MVEMTEIQVVVVIAGTVDDFTTSDRTAFKARQREALCPTVDADGQRCPGLTIELRVEPASVRVTSVVRYNEDESGAAADDKYRYLPNYYKVKGREHFADSSSSTLEC